LKSPPPISQHFPSAPSEDPNPIPTIFLQLPLKTSHILPFPLPFPPTPPNKKSGKKLDDDASPAFDINSGSTLLIK
jgi:hypothetical protein